MVATNVRLIPVVVLCAGLLAPAAGAQQSPDTAFDTRVARPAYAAHGPRVLFDEAHHNFHTSTGRYLPFAKLMRADGCTVTPNSVAFSASTLASADIVVIANALGHEKMDHDDARRPAFTPDECEAMASWVRDGGALLLIADHAPMGDAARTLAARFGVEMRAAYTTDPDRADDGRPSILSYSVGRGLDDAHAIVRGRDSTETVHRVVCFTGQSLNGPPGALSLLTLSPRAVDLLVGLGESLEHVKPELRQSAAGRSQALALTFGRGRVVVLAEAAMLTAQVAGRQRTPMGMNAPGNDDRQFTLNVMRWLGGALR
ncbi:MAG: DUF4350 domain-containing protein [Candidatus Eisenbacteria bacterium]